MLRSKIFANKKGWFFQEKFKPHVFKTFSEQFQNYVILLSLSLLCTSLAVKSKRALYHYNLASLDLNFKNKNIYLLSSRILYACLEKRSPGP